MANKKKKKKHVQKPRLTEQQETTDLVVSDSSEPFDRNMTVKYNDEDPLKAMELISRDSTYSDELLKYADPKISENQFKLFIIAQCKREMYKLVEYSKWVDILEKRFKEVTVDRSDELSPGQLMNMIKFLKDGIQSSNELINSVIKDKDITNVLIIGSQTTNIGDLTKSDLLNRLYKASVDKDETPASSRSKVVEVVTEILKEDMPSDEINQLTNILTSNDSNVIVETPIETESPKEEIAEPIVENKEEEKEEKPEIDLSQIDISKMTNEEIDMALKMLQNSQSEGSEE